MLVRLSSRDDVAARVGVSPETLARWLKAEVPSARVAQLGSVARRSERAVRTAATKRIRAKILRDAMEAAEVKALGITGIHFDPETHALLGQTATQSMTVYTVRNRTTGKRRVYWTDVETAKFLRDQVAKGAKGYEELSDENIDVEFEDF